MLKSNIPISGNPRFRWCCAVFLLFLAALVARPGHAGSGRVNSDGTIDIRIAFRFPPTAADLVTVRDQVTAASHALWDASEGQLRFGNVTLAGGVVDEDLADLWMFAECFRAGTSFRCDGSLIGVRGSHVSQSLCADGPTLAHEFCHLALGLGDEYSEQNRFGACWGFGPCIDAGADTPQNQCIMQNQFWTEFCTAGGHDLLVGDGLTCAASPVPSGCTVNCEFFNHTTALYETTQQQSTCGGPCWASLLANFPFLTAPGALPAAAEPGGFTAPSFNDIVGATDTVMLILDRSGSMLWNTERDNGEVCSDGVDNDGDGMIDETADCTQTRFAFLKAAARAWLAIANGQGVKAGIISFNTSATLDAPFQTVDATTFNGLTNTVQGLVAGGDTGIGTALDQSALIFDSAGAGLNKTAFLFSDGINNNGVAPSDAADRLRARGVRVFTISTGGASNGGELNDIAGITGGAPLDSHSGTTLVNAFIQQWARYRNIGSIIPLLPYSLNRKNQGADDRQRNAQVWVQGLETNVTAATPDRASSSVFFTIQVEPGTERLSLVMAGNMADMSGFGLHTVLIGPAGPNPNNFDSNVGDPNLRVVKDGFFQLLEVKAPNPGQWLIRLESDSGAADIQTGNLTVISDNPRVDFFTSLDRHVVNDPARPVVVTATPIYYTTLHDVDDMVASVKRPDGSIVPVPLQSRFGQGPSEDYEGLIADMPFAGVYEVRTLMSTATRAFNDPGEALFAAQPSAAVAVPPLTRTSVEYFFVPCPPVRASISGGKVTLAWKALTGGGLMLQTAEDVAGPWTDMSAGSLSAPNTYEVPISTSDAKRFFRLRCVMEPCIDLSVLSPQKVSNPWIYENYSFEMLDANNGPWESPAITSIRNEIGLTTGNQLIVKTPSDCQEVDITVVRSNEAPVNFQVFDESGKLTDEKRIVGQPAGPETITLTSKNRNLRRIVITAPNDEMILQKICCK